MKKLVTAILFFASIATATPPTGTIKISIEGLSIGTGHSISDTVWAYLSKSGTTRPKDVIDFAYSIVDSYSLLGSYDFNRITTAGNYYLIIAYKNTLLTFSQPIYLDPTKNFNYDFTSSKSQAVGNNLKLTNGRWSIISGDVNDDQIIDAADLMHVENGDWLNYTGLQRYDLGGDYNVDAVDRSIVENNLGAETAFPYLQYPVMRSQPIKSDVNSNNLILPYTPVIYHNGVFYLYWIDEIGSRLDTSLNGIDFYSKARITVNPNHTPSRGDSMYSTIRRGNLWLSGWTCHSGSGSSYTEWINLAFSNNGYQYVQYAGNPLNFHPGEDLSFFDNTDSIYCYIRPNIPSVDPRRKVGLMRSQNFINWTKIDTIISFSNTDYYNPVSELYLKQPYNMNVFRVGADWWGFLHVFRLNNNNRENFGYPYTGLESTIETHLMYSRNGRNWSYTNNKKAFLGLHDSVKQVYALPTVVGNELWIYSFENTLRHADYTGNQAAKDFAKGKYWKIYLYKLPIEELNYWKP